MLEISNSNNFDGQPSQFNSSSFITPIVNVAINLILNTAATPNQYSDFYCDMKARIQSLEDKLLSEMKTVISHLLNDIFNLRNDIMLLKKKKKEKKKEKPTDYD